MTIKIFKLLTSLPFASLFIKHTECTDIFKLLYFHIAYTNTEHSLGSESDYFLSIYVFIYIFVIIENL